MTKTTDAAREVLLDAAYRAGKQAFRKDFGLHGPTLRPGPFNVTPCPYDAETPLAEAWDRGYRQDVRRVR